MTIIILRFGVKVGTTPINEIKSVINRNDDEPGSYYKFIRSRPETLPHPV